MKKGGIVYSTNKKFSFNSTTEDNQEIDRNDFILSVCYEKKGRAGKGVTIIKGFKGSIDKLKDLAKLIKKSYGIGGNTKNGEIILQGRIQEKIIQFLNKKGFKTKKIGG